MARRRRRFKGRNRRGADKRPPQQRGNRTQARRLPSRPTGVRSATLPGNPPQGGRRSPVSRTLPRAFPFPPRAGARADTSRSRRSVVRDSAGTPRGPCRKACSTARPAASSRPRGETARSPAPARTPPPRCARRPPTPRRSSGGEAGTIGRANPRSEALSPPPRRRRRERSPPRRRGATMRQAQRPRCRAGTRRSYPPAADQDQARGASPRSTRPDAPSSRRCARVPRRGNRAGGRAAGRRRVRLAVTDR